MAIGFGSWTVSGPGPDGKTVTQGGRYLTQYRKVNGVWKAAYDVTSLAR